MESQRYKKAELGSAEDRFIEVNCLKLHYLEWEITTNHLCFFYTAHVLMHTGGISLLYLSVRIITS